MHPRRALSACLALLLVAAAATGCRPAAAEPSAARKPAGPVRHTDVALARDSEILNALVPQRTTLASLLESHRLGDSEAAAVVNSIASKFDLRRFRAGQPYRLERFFDGRLREFIYEVDLNTLLIVRRSEDPATGPVFHAEVAPIEKRIAQVVVEGAISRETPSLLQALDAAGERIELGLALAEVFSGDIDFNNDLQPGDAFRLVVERAERADGAFGGYGPILAAEFVNGGKKLQAIRFTPPDGKPAYYDAQGRAIARFFLKSPLKFEPRITSRFSRARRHPVLNYTRAHNGVDYAAPSGSAVGAVAAGVVTFAGWSGGGGRTVKVRHGGGYDSEYLHLSVIAPGIRPGVRVGQGELVGRVGSTGLATGPHLHYGLKRNGTYVNPVREHHNMPPGEPIPAAHLAAFAVERDRLFQQLSTLKAANNN